MNFIHERAPGASRNPFVINWHVTEACNYYSPSILDVGAGEAFSRIGWSAMKFEGRYLSSTAEEQA